MLTISNNIKKIALSLLVACLAIGFSAFTNASEEIKNENLFDKVYYHLGDSYVVATDVPAGYTCQADELSCQIQFTTANQPVNDDPIAEADLDDYTYTPIEGEGSYQEP